MKRLGRLPTPGGKTSFSLVDPGTKTVRGWIKGPSKNGTDHWTFKVPGYHIGDAPTLAQAHALAEERVS